MAGQRIKVIGDIGAAALETTKISSNIPQAGAQAWADAFEAMMLAAGFARTADTGQLGAIPVFPGNVNVIGYRIYALQDEFSATSPLYVKVQFAWVSRGAATSAYRLRLRQVDMGLATDGAGNLTGSTFTAFTMSSTAMSAVVASQIWVGNNKTIAWRKDYTTLCVMSPSSMSGVTSDPAGNYNYSTGEVFFGVSRLRDYQGNVDTSGFMIYGVRSSTQAGNAYFTDLVNAPNVARLTAGSVLAVNECAAQLAGPKSAYRLASDSSVIFQPFLQGRTTDDAIYYLDGVLSYQDQSLLGVMTQVSVSGVGGAKTYLAAGCLPHAFDLYQVSNIARTAAGNNYNLYLGYQPYNTNMGLCLDWSD